MTKVGYNTVIIQYTVGTNTPRISTYSLTAQQSENEEKQIKFSLTTQKLQTNDTKRIDSAM